MLINKTKLTITTQQPSQINSIQIEVVLNTSISDSTTNSSPVDSGQTKLFVQILDEDHNHLLYDEIAYLNPTIVNQPFYVKFTDNSSLRIDFGYFLGKDGTLLMTASNLIANTTMLNLVYNTTAESIIIAAGEITINTSEKDISKQNQIVLFED